MRERGEQHPAPTGGDDVHDRHFDRSHLERRLARVRAEMERRGIERLVTTSPPNIYYLTGHFTQAVRDLMVLVVELDAEPVLFLPHFEHARFEASASLGSCRNWTTGADPIAFVKAELQGASHRCTALDGGAIHSPYQVLDRLRAALEAEIAMHLVEGVRLIKDEAELAHLRAAAAITDRAVDAAAAACSEGASDFAIAAEALRAMVAAGSEPIVTDPYVGVGWRAGVPHSNRGGSVLRPGEPVFIELGATRARYTAPLMRTVVCGEVPEALARLAACSEEALSAVMAEARDGVPAAQVATAGLAGLTPVLEDIYFHHNFGYSVGASFAPGWLDCPHFAIVRDNPEPLRAGMVFHIPMFLRIKGRSGAGFSETVVVGENGAERLSRLPRRLYRC